jgi:hypothetical protein
MFKGISKIQLLKSDTLFVSYVNTIINFILAVIRGIRIVIRGLFDCNSKQKI